VNVASPRIRAGSFDGFAQRAVGIAGAVIGVVGLGHRERGGEEAAGRKTSARISAYRIAAIADAPTLIGLGLLSFAGRFTGKRNLKR
jgi:hypothetical protein